MAELYIVYMKSILGAVSVTFNAIDDRNAVKTAAKIVRQRIDGLELDGAVVITCGGRLIGEAVTVERMAIFAISAESISALYKHNISPSRQRYTAHPAAVDNPSPSKSSSVGT